MSSRKKTEDNLVISEVVFFVVPPVSARYLQVYEFVIF